MTIQTNTDKTLNSEKRSYDFITSQTADALQRMEPHITKIEVHLIDKYGSKGGANDVSCLLEARIEGKQPIAVTNLANSMDLAVTGAIDKIKTSIENTLGEIQKH